MLYWDSCHGMSEICHMKLGHCGADSSYCVHEVMEAHNMHGRKCHTAHTVPGKNTTAVITIKCLH